MNKSKNNSPDKNGIESARGECFVIMPIAEVDGYPANHFRRVYEDVIKPACKISGYKAVRADDGQSSNLIHLEILRKTIESPIAICDLSTRNPNVLFELGVRQAFDRPVVLIQEIGTPKIFDIGPLRYLEYSKDMRYHDVMSTQQQLAEYISETISSSKDAGNVNSIVRLMSLADSAKLPDISGSKEAMSLDLMRSEMHQMRRMVEMALMERQPMRQPLRRFPQSPVAVNEDVKRMAALLDALVADDSAKDSDRSVAQISMLIDECNDLRSKLNHPRDIERLAEIMVRATDLRAGYF